MKKYDKLIEAVGGLEDDLIEEHLNLQAEFERKNEKNNCAVLKASRTISAKWRKWTVAACLCLAVIMVAALLPKLWADPTPPTPSNSDIFYNENGELDEKLIFANLSQVVWDTSVTSPEEEKPLGQIYEWNGLRLEEDLYNAIVNAGENDLFAVRVIYDGTALYERHSYFYEMEDAKEYLEQLKSEAEMLEEFKAEADAFFAIDRTDEEVDDFHNKCSVKYKDDIYVSSLVNKFLFNGKYDSEAVDKKLTELYNIIPEQDEVIDVNRTLLENAVLLNFHGLVRNCGMNTARLIDERVVTFSSKRLLKLFLLNIKEVEFVDANEFIFALAPAYLAERLEDMVDPPANGYYDPSGDTAFAFSKLKFYSTDTKFTANLDVIKEVKKCYDYYDDLTFTVTCSGKIPAEKLEAMKYSSIEQSPDGSTVTVTVNYADFDSDALKNLSRDTNVWRVFVSYPEGAEMGFAKDKIYFGWPVGDPMVPGGIELFNGRDLIIGKIKYVANYEYPINHPLSDDILIKIVASSPDVDRNEMELSLNIRERLNCYKSGVDDSLGKNTYYVELKEVNLDELIKVIKELSHEDVVSRIIIARAAIPTSN